MTNLTTKLNKLMLDDSPSEKLMNPFTGTVERKIGNTWYLLETVCDGNEPLTHKVKRLIFSDKEALCS